MTVRHNDMIFAAASSPSPAPVVAPGITDWITGIGTVALAFATVVTLIATVWITTTDRRRADDVQRRVRQEDAASRLLGRVAELIQCVSMVPAALAESQHPNPDAEKARQVVQALEYGAHAEVVGLGDARAAEQYRDLAILTLWVASISATRNGPPGGDNRVGVFDYTSRVRINLRRYALFVRVSLENLIEYGQSLDPGDPMLPDLDWVSEDGKLWMPAPTPRAWLSAVRLEPDDPLAYPDGNIVRARLKRFLEAAKRMAAAEDNQAAPADDAGDGTPGM